MSQQPSGSPYPYIAFEVLSHRCFRLDLLSFSLTQGVMALVVVVLSFVLKGVEVHVALLRCQKAPSRNDASVMLQVPKEHGDVKNSTRSCDDYCSSPLNVDGPTNDGRHHRYQLPRCKWVLHHHLCRMQSAMLFRICCVSENTHKI